MTIATANGATSAPPAAPAAKPGVQTPGQPPAPAQAPPAVDHAAELAKLDGARRAIELKERQHVVERRKFSEERESQKKTWGEKLSRLERYEKEDREAKLNPEAFLKSKYGDNWYDTITAARVNGGVPTADVLASEIARAKEEIRSEFTEKEAQRQKEAAEQGRQAEAAARKALEGEMQDFLKSNGKEYPVFKKLGDEGYVARLLAHRIEAEYNRTERRDETSGRVLAPGKILTTKEAADLLESDILGLAEEAAAHEKYQPKLREKLQPPKPAPPAPGAPTQQRRTLSNDLTGTTPSGRTPSTNDEERREKAIAARNSFIAAKAPRT